VGVVHARRVGWEYGWGVNILIGGVVRVVLVGSEPTHNIRHGEIMARKELH